MMRMSGALPALLHVPLCHAEQHLYLYHSYQSTGNSVIMLMPAVQSFITLQNTMSTDNAHSDGYIYEFPSTHYFPLIGYCFAACL